MKKIAASFFLLFFIYNSYTQTLTDKTPWFQPYNLTSITFIDDNIGWMTSAEKNLMKTKDGGYTWSDHSTTPAIDKIFAFSETNLIGRDSSGKSYYSTDGGLTWSEIIYPAAYQIKTIYPPDFNTIYAIGSKETILKTTNRGQTWQVQRYSSSSQTIFNAMYFLNTNYGWASGYIYNTNHCDLYKTTDGGNTWIYCANKYSEDIQFADTLNGYSTSNGYIHKTTDGGLTWDLSKSLVDQVFSSMKVTLDNKVFLSEGLNAASNGRPHISISTDGGIGWLSTNIEGDDFRITGFHVFSDGKAIACGERGFVARMDQWRKFTPVTPKSRTTISAVIGINACSP